MKTVQKIIVTALAGTARLLFFCDVKLPGIRRMRMDGSAPKLLSSSARQMVKPVGLTLDLAARHLYWADAYLDTVERVDYNGENRVQVLWVSSLCVQVLWVSSHRVQVLWVSSHRVQVLWVSSHRVHVLWVSSLCVQVLWVNSHRMQALWVSSHRVQVLRVSTKQPSHADALYSPLPFEGARGSPTHMTEHTHVRLE